VKIGGIRQAVMTKTSGYGRRSLAKSWQKVQISVPNLKTSKVVQVSYTDLRQNLARYMDQAVDDHIPILVTRQGGKGNVVILSEEEFEGWQETVHLLSNPGNARRLLESIREAEAGLTTDHELVEPHVPAKP
jgi:antitoxin YefM